VKQQASVKTEESSADHMICMLCYQVSAVSLATTIPGDKGAYVAPPVKPSETFLHTNDTSPA